MVTVDGSFVEIVFVAGETGGDIGSLPPGIGYNDFICESIDLSGEAWEKLS